MPESEPTTALARIDTQSLLEKAIDKGLDPEQLRQLVDLAKEVRAMQAREAFFDAMARFKARVPAIVKTKLANIGRFSYKFAPLGNTADLIDPLLAAEGLSYRWKTPKIEATKVTVECIVAHRLGHEETSGPMEMPIMEATQRREGGEGGANAMQRVGISQSYAERRSLMAVLGLVAQEDTDAHVEGGGGDEAEGSGATAGPQDDTVISEGQAKRFTAIARGAKWSDDQVAALLREHGYETPAAIRTRDYDKAVERLKQGPAAP